MLWWQGLIVFVVVFVTVTSCVTAVIREIKR